MTFEHLWWFLFISASGFAHLIPLLSKLKKQDPQVTVPPAAQNQNLNHLPVNSTYQYHTDQLGNGQLA